MKEAIRHTIRLFVLVLTWAFLTVSCTAQEGNSPYYFEEEDVVFVFDVRLYAKALLGENALQVDFADLGIKDVALTGEFNNWSKDGWKMRKRDEFTFEIRKKIQDFNDPFPFDFRYIINGRYIADPEGQITDPRQFQDNFLEDIYKVDFTVIDVVEKGNVVFSLKGYTHASEVILAGSFNSWNEQELKMIKTAEGWELHANLPSGRYEYKFIVDGEWMHDPANKTTVKNEHNTLNSVLDISEPVLFILHGFPDAKKVILPGSFNDWNERKLEMYRKDEHWEAVVNLPAGKHTYKFIVDGQWMTDPANPVVEDDGHGNKNSVKFVQ
jgi:hypothetical protein